MEKVLVIGSINMDLIIQTDHFPALNETVIAKRHFNMPGGKAANQAIAAHRLGAKVRLLGCVGSDYFGEQLLDSLQQSSIDTRHIHTTQQAATGVCYTTVCKAQRTAVLAPGANSEFCPADIYAAEDSFAWADVVLAQLESPIETVEAALTLARQYKKPFLLNPAPAAPLPARMLDQISLLLPNQHELTVVCPPSREDWKKLLVKHAGKIVMTCGADGAWFADETGTLQHQRGFSVSAIDKTGAADAFCAAMAVFLKQGLHNASERACAAGALATTRMGAQEGLPKLAELEQFLISGKRNGNA